MLRTATRIVSLLPLFLMILLVCGYAGAQTFRGGMNGTVTDATGAVEPGAKVVATQVETGVVHSMNSTNAGDFAFADLPLGMYSLTVSAPGFATQTVNSIQVSAGSVYTATVRLTVGGTSSNVEVSASALTLDTTTVTQTTVVESKAVAAMPLNGRDFTQLVALTPGFAGYSAGGQGSLNGTRFDQINWQIDGIDNNDLWANVVAVNQGGVLGIAGVILPVDAIDQFSVQAQGAPESGRNPGGVVNLGLRSGTNTVHGSGYYFNRNEAFAKATPFLGYGDRKQENRNYNAGGSLGLPIVKDKLFFFGAFETQLFTIGQQGQATEPSAAYQTLAKQVLTKYNVPVNPVSQNLLGVLWPAYSLTGPSQANNYFSPNPEHGHSYNGLVKIDYALNAKNNLSFHWFSGEGNQMAPNGSQLVYFYEVAPIHIQNYALVLNSAISNSISNQVLIGVNYFNQIFNDNKKDFDLLGTGLNTGSKYPTVAPHIRISNFDAVGSVAPSGRNDITGHLTDTLAVTKGKHELRFGGEFRQAQIDAFNSGNSTGLFNFRGTAGPWAKDTTFTDKRVYSLADFLAGYVASSNLATGQAERQVFINTFDLFAQDAWRVSPRLTLNYGVRYDYEGPLHNGNKDLSIFLPGQGIVFQGAGIGSVYPAQKTNFSPRVGFSYQPDGSGTTVIRGGYGFYYDQPIVASFLNNHTSNASPLGLQANPAGATPFFTLSKSSYTIFPGQQIFPSSNVTCTVSAPCSAFTVNQNWSTPYVMSYNLNVQRSLGSKMVAQIGYVGNESRHLLATIDINQAALATSANYNQQASRPFYSAYPNYSNINQLGTIATGNYNSLQASLKMQGFRGFTSQFSYTYGHALDDVSVSRSTLPQDSFNLKGDYGNTDIDVRQTLSAYATYSLPDFGRGPKLLVNGWQINSLLNLHTGQPFTVYNDSDTTGTDENAQRVNQVGDPRAGVNRTFMHATPTDSAYAQWVNPSAFASPATGTFGTMRRNQLFGPGFSEVDLSFFKTTPIGERVKVQLRAEIFNVFNRNNFANPNNTLGGGFQLYDTIGDNYGAPGIGPGEPLNLQLGGKITF